MRRLRKHLIGWAFILPWVIGFLWFTLIPFVMSLALSFTNYQLGRAPEFVGLQNFRTMFLQEPKFWTALRVSFQYTFVVVPLTVAEGVLVALLLNQKVRGVAFYRTAFYLPAMISNVGWMLLWVFILGKNGAINWVLAKIGIEGPAYFMHQEWALWALMFMTLFTVGSSMLITLAALQSVPQALYDAVAIDGGGELAKFRHVTLPQISPAIFYNLTMGIIASLQTWQVGYVMTEGGPRNATLFYGLYLYYNAFQYNRMGYASALAWVIFVVILAFTGLNFWGSRRWVYYEAEQPA